MKLGRFVVTYFGPYLEVYPGELHLIIPRLEVWIEEYPQGEEGRVIDAWSWGLGWWEVRKRLTYYERKALQQESRPPAAMERQVRPPQDHKDYGGVRPLSREVCEKAADEVRRAAGAGATIYSVNDIPVHVEVLESGCKVVELGLED